jgi:hypothetical protein
MMDLKRRVKRFFGKRKMGMRGRIVLGFSLLVLILFLSSIIAVFEYRHMSNYVSEMIAENIKSINTAHKLLSSCDNYNMTLLTAISDDSVKVLPGFDEEQFADDYEYLRGAVSGQSALSMADSVRYAYSAYLLVAGEIESVWLADFSDNNTRDWYFNRLQPIYYRLKGYIDRLSDYSYNALQTNSEALQESFYRSIMPEVIAVSVGILIAFLFMFFIVSRYVSPIRKMLSNIHDYERFDKTYTYTFEGGDELSELNEEVKDIIEQNISLKRHYNSNRED